MSQRDQLLADYDAHEDGIEISARPKVWDLADWLAEHVPNADPGPKSVAQATDLTIHDLVGRRGRSLTWLKEMRKVAKDTAPDRIDGVSARVYLEALRNADWNLTAANAALREKGTRLRDHSGKQESVSAILEALRKRLPEERAEVVADVLEDLDAEGHADLISGLAESLEPKAPRRIVGEGPEQYEVDRFIANAVIAIHKARQRIDAYQLHSLRPLSELRDALDQIADDVAAVTAAVRAAIEEEAEHEAA